MDDDSELSIGESVKLVARENGMQKTGKPIRLLLIDDDRSLGDLLTEYCEPLGFVITVAVTGEDGIRVATSGRFNLVILDVMLPGIDGFETLRILRSSLRVPVLMLTTRSATRDRVLGLNGGADDYLTKPFQPEELVARVTSILRRSDPVSILHSMSLGDIEFDEKTRSLQKDSIPIVLTGAEFHLMKLLLANPGFPLPREELIRQIFGRSPHSIDRSIDNLINNLRRKLGPHKDGSERFKSVRNVGYSYVLPMERE